MDQRAPRSPARFLAPLALIAFVLVFFAVLSSSGGNDKGGSGANSAATTTTKDTAGTTTGVKGTKQDAKKPRTYTIERGDTLGAISDKTGVPLTTIMELNPAVDSNALTTGQKIKLE
jgi:LysM repeat protein